MASGTVFTVTSPEPVEGQPVPNSTVHVLGSHLEPGRTTTSGPATRSVAVDPTRKRLYTVNGVGGLSMLDATSLQTLATAQFDLHLLDVAVDPAAGLVYVSQWSIPGGKVHVLRADDLSVVATVTESGGFHGPQGLAVDADAQRVYVARDFRSGGPSGPVVTALSVIRRVPGGQHVIERTVPLGEPAVQPIDVAVDGPANLVFVAGLGSAQVHPRLIVLDRSTHVVLGHERIPGPARAVAARPGTGLAYVVGEAGLTVVDGRTRTRELTLKLGRQPHAVAVDPDTGATYVGDRIDGTITRIDAMDGLG